LYRLSERRLSKFELELSSARAPRFDFRVDERAGGDRDPAAHLALRVVFRNVTPKAATRRGGICDHQKKNPVPEPFARARGTLPALSDWSLTLDRVLAAGVEFRVRPEEMVGG